MNLDEIDLGDNGEDIKKEFLNFNKQFKKEHPDYDLVLQSPYVLIGQKKDKPDDFVALGVVPITDHFLKEGPLYWSGFAKGVTGVPLSDKSLNGDLGCLHKHGILNGEFFREYMSKRRF